jgi:steroid delta-isomerase-like uncharacterized protein
MSTTNHQLATDLMAAWNAHDVERVTLLHAVDFVGVDVSRARNLQGQDAFRASVQRFLAAFPDLYFRSELLVEGNRVAIIWELHATHKGHFMNIPPSGHSFAVRGVSTLTIANEQIVHGMYIWDVAGFLRAVGLLPEL